MLFFFFEKRLQLPWRNWSVSLALGLGLTSAVDLIGSYVGPGFPTKGTKSIAYTVWFSWV